MVTRLRDGEQLRLEPACTVILISRPGLPLAKPARRHRGKQGRENAFKGPLTDLGLHHPPSKGQRASQAFCPCTQIAQLLLRLQCHLPLAGARRHGLRPLMRTFVRTAGRLVRSGRSYCPGWSVYNPCGNPKCPGHSQPQLCFSLSGSHVPGFLGSSRRRGSLATSSARAMRKGRLPSRIRRRLRAPGAPCR